MESQGITKDFNHLPLNRNADCRLQNQRRRDSTAATGERRGFRFRRAASGGPVQDGAAPEAFVGQQRLVGARGRAARQVRKGDWRACHHLQEHRTDALLKGTISGSD